MFCHLLLLILIPHYNSNFLFNINMPTPQAESAMAVASISTSTANTPTDIEAQKQQQVASTTTNSTPGRAGKRLGIACFVLLLIGFPFNFIQPVGTFVCNTVVIIITSTITCGCCCGSDLNLQPRVKGWSTATLVFLCITLAIQIIGITLLAEDYNPQNTSEVSEGNSGFLMLIWAMSLLFNAFALISAAIFTFKVMFVVQIQRRQ